MREPTRAEEIELAIKVLLNHVEPGEVEAALFILNYELRQELKKEEEIG